MNPPYSDKQACWLAFILAINKIARKGHMWIMCHGRDCTTPRPLTMTAVEPSPSTTLDHTWPQLERWQKWKAIPKRLHTLQCHYNAFFQNYIDIDNYGSVCCMWRNDTLCCFVWDTADGLQLTAANHPSPPGHICSWLKYVEFYTMFDRLVKLIVLDI